MAGDQHNESQIRNVETSDLPSPLLTLPYLFSSGYIIDASDFLILSTFLAAYLPFGLASGMYPVFSALKDSLASYLGSSFSLSNHYLTQCWTPDLNFTFWLAP
jgi:hypothetical protein